MRYIIVALFTLICFGSKAQMAKGNVYVSGTAAFVDLDGFTSRWSGGVQLDAMITDKWSIHYNILGGKRYFHMPLAPFGGVFVGLAIGSTTDSTGSRKIGAGILFGLLTAIIPEGIAYNIHMNNNLVLSPYISPLEFEYITNNSQKGGTDSYAGGGVGLRSHFLLMNGKFRVSPFAEYKIHYAKNIHNGTLLGVQIGMRLNGD